MDYAVVDYEIWATAAYKSSLNKLPIQSISYENNSAHILHACKHHDVTQFNGTVYLAKTEYMLNGTCLSKGNFGDDEYNYSTTSFVQYGQYFQIEIISVLLFTGVRRYFSYVSLFSLQCWLALIWLHIMYTFITNRMCDSRISFSDLFLEFYRTLTNQTATKLKAFSSVLRNSYFEFKPTLMAESLNDIINDMEIMIAGRGVVNYLTSYPDLYYEQNYRKIAKRISDYENRLNIFTNKRRIDLL
ncbi:unnamed protein product [Oppiella nova]|uniref:Uncharacterized protein n=1 Tax=Oppiella nova TaxID=334625 RepID=A0A7R9MHY3_9ACAR|nr:unnamed protein product [Oppiella nova]CAG2177281.1 unnamed protein product [Oppiella nova]